MKPEGTYPASFPTIGRMKVIVLGVIRRHPGIVHVHLRHRPRGRSFRVSVNGSMEDGVMFGHKHLSQPTQKILNASLMLNHLVTLFDAGQGTRQGSGSV